MDEILAGLQRLSRTLTDTANASLPVAERRPKKPILVKVAPDLSLTALDEILELVGPREVAGVVATNTTTARPPTSDAASTRTYSETGGLSGRPLRNRSTEIVKHLFTQTKGSLPIIGVGGIFTVEDAWEKITAGASLIQVYTGLVYQGPGLPRELVHGLAQKLKSVGLESLASAVGIQSTSSR